MPKVYQIKITIKKDKIWRRVQIPLSYTFWDLHIIVCDMMEWWGSLYHYFQIVTKSKTKYVESFPDLRNIDTTVEVSWNTLVKKYLPLKTNKISYVYHGFDEFICEITLEKTLNQVKDKPYPNYMAGNKTVPFEIENLHLTYLPPGPKEEIFDVKKIMFTGTLKALYIHKSKLIDSCYGNYYHTQFF